MEDNLVGYLLKALDPDTQWEVEVHLRTHPEARQRLEALRRGLEPLSFDPEEPEPPPDLAVNTIARVAEFRCRKLPPAPPPTPAQVVSGGGRAWWRRADVLVAAALLVGAVGLTATFLPVLWHERYKTECANNLRNFWHALDAYARTNGDRFPELSEDPPHHVAGIFVPVLREAGTLGPGVSVVCPARGNPREPNGPSVHQLKDLFDQSPSAFRSQANALAGGYAYSLGYWERDDLNPNRPGKLCGLNLRSGNGTPILSDVPPDSPVGNSPNHGQRGQNVLFVGGEVKFVPERRIGGADDIFRNGQGRVAPGVDARDAVLGASGSSVRSDD